MKDFWQQFKYWIGGAIGGPGVSVILQKWIITEPSEWLVALIYVLGFGVYFFTIYLNYRQRIKQVEFLKHMVHTREEDKLTDGTIKIKDYGRIDENSIKIIKELKELL